MFCAKFAFSRTPRTANIRKSFIVLRCMWKELAPFVHPTIAVLLVIRSAIFGKPKKKKRGANKFLSRTRPSACPSPPCKKLRRLERGAPGLGRTDTKIFLRRTNIFVVRKCRKRKIFVWYLQTLFLWHTNVLCFRFTTANLSEDKCVILENHIKTLK